MSVGSKLNIFIALFISIPATNAFRLITPRRLSTYERHQMALYAEKEGEWHTHSRRELIQDAVRSSSSVAAAISTVMAVRPLHMPCWADVSDGNSLPQGAAQFSRVIETRTNLAAVTKRVREASSSDDKIDEKEWDNISGFLRKVYASGEDMKSISKGMTDEKRKQAEENARLLQKFAKAGDIPTSKKDSEGFIFIAAKLDKLYEDFFDLLSDVPDEI